MKFTKAVELKHNWLLRKLKKWFWEVQEEFVWYIDYNNKKEYVLVEVDFKTNFWSIPKFLRWFFDYMNITFVLHDYLYSKKGKTILVWSWIQIKPTRYESDVIMFYWLLVEWYWFFKSSLAFLWVRVFWYFRFEKKIY